MKAIKTLLSICALVAVPAFGDVEALYWQVDSASNPENIPFTYAAMVGTDGTSNTYLEDSAGSVFQRSIGSGTTTEQISSLLDPNVDYTSWSFFIELWNYDNGNWTLAGTTTSETYTKLKTDGAIRSSMSMSTALFTPTASVPEPTSGLLLVIGGALLALRRRCA